VPWDVAAGGEVGKGEAVEPGKLGCFAERKDFLSVERDGEFGAKARLDFRRGEPQTCGDGLRDVEAKGHSWYLIIPPLESVGRDNGANGYCANE